MLVLTRRIGEGITIEPGQNIDPDTTIKELFSEGPIVIEVVPHRGGRRTTIAICAPRQLNIIRSEKTESKSMFDPAKLEKMTGVKKK